MSVNRSIECDVCGGRKRKVNHWFTVAYRYLDATQREVEIIITPWSRDTAFQRGRRHLCGRECLNREVSAWTESQGTPPSSLVQSKGIIPAGELALPEMEEEDFE